MITDAEVLTAFLRDRDLPCPTCEYNLRDNASAVCPECGTELTILEVIVTVDPTLLCVRCRYDLKGLPPGGMCPECGTPIERSRCGDRLSLADPAWLARLARGQALITWGICLLPLGMVLVVLAMVVRAGSWSTKCEPIVTAMVLFSGVIVSVAALFSSGVLLATAQDPSMRGFERTCSSRKLARCGLMAQVVFIGLALAIDALPLPLLTRVPARTALLLLAVVSATISIVSLLEWLGSRAMLIPARKLGRRAHRVGSSMAWAMPLFLGGLVVAAAPIRRLVAPGSFLDGDALNVVLGCSSPCTGFIFLVLLCRFLAVVLGCRRAFRGCYEQARARAQGRASVHHPRLGEAQRQCALA